MKKLEYVLKILIITLLIFGCNRIKQRASVEIKNEVDSSMQIIKESELAEVGAQRLDSISLILLSDTVHADVEKYIHKIMTDKMIPENLEVQTDTAYQILEREGQSLKRYSWYVFFVKGEFLPSHSPFSLCGSYKNADTVCFGYSSSIVDVNMKVTNCEVSRQYIIIYGINPPVNRDVNMSDVGVLAAFHPEIIVSH